MAVRWALLVLPVLALTSGAAGNTPSMCPELDRLGKVAAAMSWASQMALAFAKVTMIFGLVQGIVTATGITVRWLFYLPGHLRPISAAVARGGRGFPAGALASCRWSA